MGHRSPATDCLATFSPGPRSLIAHDRLASHPAVGLFYRIPGSDHTDTPALQLLGIVLGRGRDARLARVLGGNGLTIATQAGVLGDRAGPGVFGLFAVAADGVTADSLQRLLVAQSIWATSDSLGEAELARAKNIYRATAVSGHERPEDLAEALHHAVSFGGGAETVNTSLTKTMAVSLGELRRVARSWFTPANALTLVVTPEAGQ